MDRGQEADMLLRFIHHPGRVVAQRGSDRRRNPRFPCCGEAQIRSLATGLSAHGTVGNLSLSGCRLHLAICQFFRKAEAVEISFCVRQLPVRVLGSVRQVPSGQVVGVEFTMLSERGKRQLLELIDELAEISRDQAKAAATQT
jgi:hypothetical protein